MGYWGTPRPVINNPTPWKIGQHVYLVDNAASQRKFGARLGLSMLGHKFTINKITYSRWGGEPRFLLKPRKGGLTAYPIAPEDIGKENTFVNDFANPPEYMKDIPKVIAWGSHVAHYALYLDKDEKKETWDYLKKNLNGFDTQDPCDDCYGDNCSTCEVTADVCVDSSKQVAGFINCNTDCWQDAMDMWKSVIAEWDNNPTTFAIFMTKHDLYGSDSKITFKEVQSFYKYMKQAKCLPHYFEVPADDMEKENLMFKINLRKISQERMYWYLCTLRLPVQWPGLVQLTNYFVEKGKMEPLLAYVMAHASCPAFHGGHACFDPTPLRRVTLNESEVPALIMDEVLETAVRAHKFLTTKTIPYITDEEGTSNGWVLNRHVQPRKEDKENSQYPPSSRTVKYRFKTTFKTVKDVTCDTLHTFSAKERKLKAA